MAKKKTKTKKVTVQSVPVQDGSIEILRNGKDTQFWKAIVNSLTESQEFIREQMEDEDFKDLPADQYKLMNELMKAKLKFLETLKNTPDNIISWLEQPPEDRMEFDPYAKAKDL